MLFAGLTANVFAQPSIGIVWPVPEDTAKAKQQLSALSDHGVSYVEVRHPVSHSVLNLLSDFEFAVLVRTNHELFSITDIINNRDRLLEEYVQISRFYRSHFNVTAIGLLTNSHTSHPGFRSEFKPVADSLRGAFNKSFYFYNHPSWYDFDIPSQPFGMIINDREFSLSDLDGLNSRFHQDLSMNSNVIYFFDASWFLDAIETYPELSESLLNYHQTKQWKLPLPNVQMQSVQQNWMVLMLLLLWGALALQLKYLPYVRPMIVRYFLSHRFFVEDILQYRERSATGSLLMMAKHAVIGGTIFYICSRMLFTETGVEAFFHHLPFLAITGVNYVSFFFFGLILILFTQVISVLWLHLPAKNLEHFSQTINLYAGILYLDFIVITIMVTLYAAEIGASPVLSLGLIYILIWFVAFNFAAIDGSGNTGKGRLLYLLITIGLHTILTISFLILLLVNTNIIQILDLAISL